MKKILLTVLLAAGAWAATAQPLPRVAPEQVGMDAAQLRYADEAINEAIRSKEIPGAVLAVVRHGKMAYLKAYGNRQVYPTTLPMTVNTVFDLASCSKPVGTAISALILVERGQLRTLDAVDRYIPGFRNWKSADGKDSVTIRVADLLTHTSGLPPYGPTEELRKKYGSPNPEGLMTYIAQCPRDFEPKTDFQYSCLNYITLQHIVEGISGQSLRDFAAENIFQVLGMEHTDYLPCAPDKNGRWVNTDRPRWIKNGEAEGVTPIAPTEIQPDGSVLLGQVHDPLARVLNGGISGNAGVFSSADDLAVLCAALQNGGTLRGRRILSPLTVKAMRTVPRATATLGRTLGWDNFTAYASNNGDLFSSETYGHTGYTGTSIVIDPVTDTSVILLINAVHPRDEHSVVRLRSLVSNAVAASIRVFEPQPAVKSEALPVYTDHYYQRFLQFEREPAITSNDIVMLGNSLTENGGDWGEKLQKKNIINRGIVGDALEGIDRRLHQILPGHPAKLFLMAGVNDLSHGLSPDSIASLTRRVADRVLRESPSTKLYLQSLLPINESFERYKLLSGKTEEIPAINERLSRLAREKNIEFINLFPLFTEKGSSTLDPGLSTDGLHLNDEGYRIWAKALRKYL